MDELEVNETQDETEIEEPQAPEPKPPPPPDQLKNLYSNERYQISTLLPPVKPTRKVVQWRMKERMKTVSVALTLCLNIGVDPPDVIKTTPCARLEAWIVLEVTKCPSCGGRFMSLRGKCTDLYSADPLSLPPPKALDSIGKALQMQYERWQPRARYKQCLDPTTDDVKKLCMSLRRTAKDERILFHYSGHGVPKPTQNGEIWVFNKTWLGTPSIYVFDCSASGLILQCFNKFADQKDQEFEKSRKKGTSSPNSPPGTPNTLSQGSVPSKTTRDYILLGACASNEVLPTNPDLPADVFTSCLTTPIKIALKWFCAQTIISGINAELIDKIPGRLTDRRTALGELNWIFTAITDTIAWNVLPQELFQKLFRQDLLVASLFRNYLLAERIMRSCKCTPLSHPKLPLTYNHPMWQAWDLAADHSLAQLPQLITDPNYEYQHSSFFTEQLTAFEVWLEFGTEDKNPPEQLPIVLQVLLSQQHRLRALELLGRFLDLGPWAVNQALSVGIFPYVLKLLQSPAVELRKILVFIWAKILALDQSCQLDLVKDNGQHYFVTVLSNPKIASEQRQQAAFILSVICNNCRPGQSACLNAKLLQICLANLSNSDSMLRRWVVLCLAKLWENHEEGKRQAIKENAHEKLCGLLTDPVPEARAAAVYALGTFIGRSGNGSHNREQRTIIELNLGLTFAVVTADSSPLVRKELVIALSALVYAYEEKFKLIERNVLKMESVDSKRSSQPEANAETPHESEENAIYEFLWKLVSTLANDPFPLVAQIATVVLKKIREQVLEELRLTQSSSPAPRTHSYTNFTGPTAGSGSTVLLPTEDLSPKPKLSKGFNFFGSSRAAIPPSTPENSTRRTSASYGPNFDVRQITEDTRSTLYEWSCQYFSLPLMTVEEIDETSPTYSERKWRLQRYNELVEESAKAKDGPGINSLENEIAILENENQMVSQLCFHPFENIIVVTDEHDGVSVWNWEVGQPITHFSNHNPPGTRITALDLLNEHDQVLVAVGADDGVVRIWGGVLKTVNDSIKDTLHLVTAWRAINLEGEHTTGAGLVLEWQQKNDLAIASGNVDVLKVWDVNRELCIQDIPTACNSCVTCLTSDKSEGGKLIVAGCWDGSIRLFDRRANSIYGQIATLSEHKACVINTCMPASLDLQIISGSSAGDVKFWDTRNMKSSLKTITGKKGDHPVMTALSVHNNYPLLAIGQDQRIKVINFNGDSLSLIRYHDGFLGQRIGPVSSLSFHPHKIMLAAGATDSIVSIYADEPNKLKPKE